MAAAAPAVHGRPILSDPLPRPDRLVVACHNGDELVTLLLPQQTIELDGGRTAGKDKRQRHTSHADGQKGDNELRA